MYTLSGDVTGGKKENQDNRHQIAEDALRVKNLPFLIRFLFF
jgi:hypothetical protein